MFLGSLKDTTETSVVVSILICDFNQIPEYSTTEMCVYFRMDCNLPVTIPIVMVKGGCL